jgi:hypothetical protein
MTDQSVRPLPRSIRPIAAALGIVGASMGAAGLPSLLVLTFALWAASSTLWIVIAQRQREYSLLWMQAAYLIIDLIGVWRWAAHAGAAHAGLR